MLIQQIAEIYLILHLGFCVCVICGGGGGLDIDMQWLWVWEELVMDYSPYRYLYDRCIKHHIRLLTHMSEVDEPPPMAPEELS